MLGIVPKMLARAEPTLDLGIAQVGITRDTCLGAAKETCCFFIRHLFLALPWLEQRRELYGNGGRPSSSRNALCLSLAALISFSASTSSAWVAFRSISGSGLAVLT